MMALGLDYSMRYNNFMSFMKKNFGKFIFIAVLVFLPLISLAQSSSIPSSGGSTTIPGSGGSTNIPGNGGSTNIPATSNTSTSGGKILNPLAGNGINTIQDFIRIALQGAIRIGFPIIALAVIYCGFLFVSAQGNPGEIEKAKSALLYTLIGAALLLGAWAIAQFISETVRTLSLISSIC